MRRSRWRLPSACLNCLAVTVCAARCLNLLFVVVAIWEAVAASLPFAKHSFVDGVLELVSNLEQS